MNTAEKRDHSKLETTTEKSLFMRINGTCSNSPVPKHISVSGKQSSNRGQDWRNQITGVLVPVIRRTLVILLHQKST